MLFGTILGDLIGDACLMFVFLVVILCWAAKSLFESEDVKDGVRLGFWAWFYSQDDD